MAYYSFSFRLAFCFDLGSLNWAGESTTEESWQYVKIGKWERVVSPGEFIRGTICVSIHKVGILISSLPLTKSNSTKDWEWVELESIDRPLSVFQTLCCWMISLKNNHVIKSSTYTTGHILSCKYVSCYVCEFWIDVLLCKLQTFSKTYTIATHLNTSLMKMKYIFWGTKWIYFESTHYFNWFSGLYNWIRPIGTIKSLNISQIKMQYLLVKCHYRTCFLWRVILGKHGRFIGAKFFCWSAGLRSGGLLPGKCLKSLFS